MSSGLRICHQPGCDKEGTQRCAQCKAVRYCSKECQTKNWKDHKLSCKPAAPKPASSNPPPASSGPSASRTPAGGIPFIGHIEGDLPPNFPGAALNGAAGLVSDPSAWAKGLTGPKQHEWLIDCYRMRIDDDHRWGGGNVHGLYAPDYTPDTILIDFFVFCQLAVTHKVVPTGWDWAAFLKIAPEHLFYAFEKGDAKSKWGGENVFQAMMGGRSLRATGEVVYGSSVMAGSEQRPAHRALEKKVQSALRARDAGALFAGEVRPDFDRVGGVVLWEKLRSDLMNRRESGAAASGGRARRS